MTSAIVPTKFALGPASASEQLTNWTAAKSEIEALQASTSLLGRDTISAVNEGVIYGGLDTQVALDALQTKYRNTGVVIEFPSGICAFSGSPVAEGFYWRGQPDTQWMALSKTNRAIQLAGSDCGIMVGQIVCPKMRRYSMPSVSSDGAHITFVVDVSAGAHDITAAESIYVQDVVTTSGSINNTPLTVSSVTPTTIAVASALTVDPAVSYPCDPMDGSGRLVTPYLYRSRTASGVDSAIYVYASNYILQNLKIKWGSGVGIFHSGASYGFDDNVHIYQTAADGSHYTGRAHDILSRAVVSEETGDDGHSVVSYMRNGGRCYNIRWEGCSVKNLYFNGRGFVVEGGNDVTGIDCAVDNCYHAALRIGSNDEIYGSNRVTFSGFKFQHCGRQTAPQGWNTDSYGAIQISSAGTTPQMLSSDITLTSGRISNSRYYGISQSSTPVRGTLCVRDVEVSESHEIGINGLSADNLVVENYSIRQCVKTGMTIPTSNVGQASYKRGVFYNVNTGTPFYLSDASASGGTITLTFKGGQGTPFSGGDVIVVRGISSSSTVSSGEEDQVAKAFALNNRPDKRLTSGAGSNGGAAYTVAAVTNSGGNIQSLTITVPTVSISGITRSSTTATATVASTATLYTGQYVQIAGANQSGYNIWAPITVASPTTFTFTVSGSPTTPATGTITYALVTDVSDAKVSTPEQAKPDAYASKQSGNSSSNDIINIADFSANRSTVDIDGVYIAEQNYVYERIVDCTANAQPYVFARNMLSAYGQAADEFVASVITTSATPVDLPNSNADSNQTITAASFKGGLWYRFGTLTAGRTDTTPTAAALANILPNKMSGSQHWWVVQNLTNQTITLAGGSGVTLSDTVLTNTEVIYSVYLSSNAPGAETVTITRRLSRQIST